MSSHSQPRNQLLLGGLLLGAALLLFVRLNAFGIWDPWELSFADAADSQLEQTAPSSPSDPKLVRPVFPTMAIAAAFRVFHSQAWAGRTVFALGGLAFLALLFFLGARARDGRTGLYAGIVAASTPLFVLNSRQMFGDSWGFFAQAAVFFAALASVYKAPGEQETATRTPVFLGLTVLACVFSCLTSGLLLGPLPALIAVAGTILVDGAPFRDKKRRDGAFGVIAITVAVLVLTTMAVREDTMAFWIGAATTDPNPPTFDAMIEHVFHSFAPWAALLPIAFGRLLGTAQSTAATASDSSTTTAETGFGAAARVGAIVWAAVAYAVHTFFSSKYGSAPFLALGALSLAVALTIRDAEESESAWPAAGVVSFLLAALLIREYSLYPQSASAGAGLADFTVPATFNPKREWRLLFAAFGAAAFLSFVASASASAPKASEGLEFLRSRWNQSKGMRAVLAVGLPALLLISIAGVVIGIAKFPALGFSTFQTTVALAIGLGLPLVFAVIYFQVPRWVAYLYGRLGSKRFLPLLGVGVLIGAYASQRYLPELSVHCSPRDVYDTYNSLAKADEPLGEFRVGNRAAKYYAKGTVRTLASEPDFVQFLREPGRRWVTFAADQLPTLDRMFREQTHQHLFVANANSARVLLATNQPVAGARNESFVANAILDREPPIEHRVNASFEDKIELVGYNLDLPHKGYVGPGEEFTITWVWRCRQPVSGYKIFLHVDGPGLRLNGDHEPVEEKYPLRFWNVGDYILDKQTLSVPANFRPGKYQMMIGWYLGEERRLSVVRAPNYNPAVNTDNRVHAGDLDVR